LERIACLAAHFPRPCYNGLMLDDLKELLSAEPFVPFRVVVTGGCGYGVFSPYQVAIGKTQLDYYFPRSDRKAVVRQNQLVAFEALNDSPKPRRRKRE
jgi:hypothetical protein